MPHPSASMGYKYYCSTKYRYLSTKAIPLLANSTRVEPLLCETKSLYQGIPPICPSLLTPICASMLGYFFVPFRAFYAIRLRQSTYLEQNRCIIPNKPTRTSAPAVWPLLPSFVVRTLYILLPIFGYLLSIICASVCGSQTNPEHRKKPGSRLCFPLSNSSLPASQDERR